MSEAATTPSEAKRSVPWLVWSVWTIIIFAASIAYAWKVADSRSAFLRWRHQVLELREGVNIWDRYYFPNPPILPIVLYPLMLMPPMVGSLLWFGIKFGMVSWSIVALTKMARGPGGSVLKSWGVGLIMLLALRPILSDLQHGNINLFILFLVVLALQLWQQGRDMRAGIALALAIAAKVTPALFVVYFLYKRSWKLLAACCLGLVLFLLVVPSAVLGPQFNWACLMKWRQNIISPYVQGDEILSTQEVNQSMPGVVTRLFTQTRIPQDHGNNGTELDLNLLSLDPELVARCGKGAAIALVLVLALLCRTNAKRRDDPRMLGEFALVVLTMLFASERSWKHHFVTLLLPLTYLVYRVFDGDLRMRSRLTIAAGLAVSALMMGSTSHEVGRLFAGGEGHEVALYYGFYLWSSVVIYLLTAWRVSVEGPLDHWPGREATLTHTPHFQMKTDRADRIH